MQIENPSIRNHKTSDREEKSETLDKMPDHPIGKESKQGRKSCKNFIQRRDTQHETSAESLLKGQEAGRTKRSPSGPIDTMNEHRQERQDKRQATTDTPDTTDMTDTMDMTNGWTEEQRAGRPAGSQHHQSAVTSQKFHRNPTRRH